MKQTTASSALGTVALGLTLSFALTACGGSGSSAAKAPRSASPSLATSTSSPAAAGDDTFGPGCSAVPTSGDGSLEGMGAAPIAAAAATNPLLRSLSAAITKAGLTHHLDSAGGLTLLAPTDDAFAKLPDPELDALLADRRLLRQVLEHHVIKGRLSPEQLAGEHRTLAGDRVSITGSGEDFGVAGDGARVLCGNISTANATVYVIDTVLMPGPGGA